MFVIASGRLKYVLTTITVRINFTGSKLHQEDHYSFSHTYTPLDRPTYLTEFVKLLYDESTDFLTFETLELNGASTDRPPYAKFM